MYARQPMARKRLYGTLGDFMRRASFCHEWSGHGPLIDLDGHRFSVYDVASATSPHSLGGKLP